MCLLPNEPAARELAELLGYEMFEAQNIFYIQLKKEINGVNIPVMGSGLAVSLSNPVCAESFGVFIATDLRGKGLGERFLHDRTLIWKAGGLEYVWCSVNRDNAIQLHLLDKAEWRKQEVLTNQAIWSITL